MTEADLQAMILRECSRGSTRLFRNSVGQGWCGEVHARTRDTVTLLNPRPVTFGLCPGSSDLIGWHERQDGTSRFVAIEVKGARTRVAEEQQRFIDAVTAAGGLAGVARSVDDVVRVLRGVST